VKRLLYYTGPFQIGVEIPTLPHHKDEHGIEYHDLLTAMCSINRFAIEASNAMNRARKAVGK